MRHYASFYASVLLWTFVHFREREGESRVNPQFPYQPKKSQCLHYVCHPLYENE